MPTRCQDCNAKFLIDASSVVNGIGCPDCGGKRLERDQPSPTHSDGELRDMVDPATQLDQGGNPLQEGVWANIDGGWQPRYKRDETFASIREAGGPFDMGDGTYPLPSGGDGEFFKCPNCGGQMGDNGECYRCGYRYGQDDPWVQHTDFSKSDPYGNWTHNPHDMVGLGPVHQGSRKTAAAPGITWTPGSVGNGGWDTEGNLHAWNAKHDPPYGVAFSHPQPFIIGADGTLLRMPEGRHENEVTARIPQTSYRNQINAAIENAQNPHVSDDPMLNHNSRSLSQEPYLPWYHQADVKRSADDAGAPISLTDAELADDETREAYLKRQEGRDPKLAFGPLLALGGRLLLGQAIGGLMKKAIGGVGNFLDQGAATPPPNAGAPPVGLVASEHTAVGVNAPVESPGSIPDYVEDHDPEAVDQQEYNDGDASPAFNNPNRDVGDGGLSQSTGEDGMKQKLQFREDGDALSHAEVELPHILEYINSDRSGLESPRIKALHEALEREIPGYLDHADENAPEVQKLLEGLHKPEGVTAANEEPVEHCFCGGTIPPEAATCPNCGRPSARKSSRQAAPVYQNTPMAPGQMQMGNGQMAMPGTHANPVQPGGMPVQGKCMVCGGTLNADGSCPQCGSGPGANQMGNIPQQTPGQQHTPVGVLPGQYSSTKEAWGLPEGHGVLGPQHPEEFALNSPEQSRAADTCPNCGNLTRFPLGVCPHCGTHPGERMAAEGKFKCSDCGTTFVSDDENPGLCPNCDSDVLQHVAADHQGPITPEQKEVFAQYLIDQGRNDEVAAMMANPGLYADEWAQYLNKSTQPPEVDPNEQQPMPQVPPEQMGQMPMPGMTAPQPTAKVATDDNPRRCPKCKSATTDLMNGDGDIRCHRCGNVWNVPVTEDTPTVKSHRTAWVIKKAYPDPLQNDSPNPVAAPAADATAPGDREQQQDSSLTWQSVDGQPLEVGAIYEMHSNQDKIPDVVKVQSVKPDSIVVQMVGEYNSPSDPQDQDGSAYVHEIPLSEAQTVGLTFVPQDDGGDQEQSQDQADQDGVGQTVNTEPVEQPHDSFPVHTNTKEAAMIDTDPFGQFQVGQQVSYVALGHSHSGRVEQGTIVGFQPNGYMTPGDPYVRNDRFPDMVKVIARRDIQPAQEATPALASVQEDLPTDHCPKCEYTHVTSSYTSPEEVQYECFRCAHQWKVADMDEGSNLAPESRNWLNEDSNEDFNFDRVAEFAKHTGGQGRDIREIAKRDPRNAEIHERLNKNAGAKFSPREQKEFIDEDGVARNADRLNLDGTHYVESAFDNSKARPDRVNDNYLGLGL